uniref:Uncharacterized protein n=1 Tax=Anguilla anguilla TaxID=7936 RepID=A0A0E9REU9_ANGAN
MQFKSKRKFTGVLIGSSALAQYSLELLGAGSLSVWLARELHFTLCFPSKGNLQ